MKVNLGGGARTTLDLVVTVVMIGVAILLMAIAAQSFLQRPNPDYTLIEPPVPAELVSLEGAMIDGCRSARIAVIEYGDFQCEACAAFANETMPSIRRRYIESCKVLFAFRNLPIVAQHTFALPAAGAAACAGHQGQFWRMHDLLYEEQDRLGPPHLAEKARRLGLDEAEFNACLDDREVLSQIRLDTGEGITLGVSSTPTLFFGILERDDNVKVVRRVSRALAVGEIEEILEGLLHDVQAPVSGR